MEIADSTFIAVGIIGIVLISTILIVIEDRLCTIIKILTSRQ